ncbi:DUF6470 family protein [Saccharibacillus sp. CPCC 101409]|uniref:DUF6470 family protein n=1 Tax=Saccharibacillus sp. CPCC 101409 TaxID=3058041 RepID=UPI002673F059|nr:DUF6470 family protein [Saccharibacillus sp. CPCC 101409]MDO3412082.1 DUF6470 family protein [Saccharibacillus sp. CPCC 101409]
MSSIPQIQIRQTPALLGMETTKGEMSIRQPKPEMHQETDREQWDIEQYKPELTIDQSRARSAYTGGTVLEMNSRLTAGFQQNFLQGLADRAQMGNQLAAIQKPGNTIAEIYGGDDKPFPLPEFRGPASMANVDVHFEVRPTRIDFTPAKVNIRIDTAAPEINYDPGKLSIYLLQKNSLEIIPPAIDTVR